MKLPTCKYAFALYFSSGLKGGSGGDEDIVV